jgi:class 3 adenylate cyclase
MPNDTPLHAQVAPEILGELNRTLFAVWRFGSNALVAWRPTATGLEILTVPKIRLFEVKDPPRRLFVGERRMGDKTFDELAELFQAHPLDVRLSQPVGVGPGSTPIALVESLFAPFAVTKTDQRAVLLLDIVGFSKLLPEQQASQLATLEFALNIAAETANAHAIKFDMRRSTTGDGFYVWNNRKGVDADVDLVLGYVLFAIFYAALKRTIASPLAVPVMRTALGLGSHYNYGQPERSGGSRNDFIVGDVTIQVARLIANCRADQILLGAFQRWDSDANIWLDEEQFIERVAQGLQKLVGLPVMGHRIERTALYLTGRRMPEGHFQRQKIRVVDKHGFEHFCFNMKLNAFLDGVEPYYCGLQHAELTQARPAG